MRLSNKIVLASLNEDKFKEFKALLASYPQIELTSPVGLIRNPEKLALVENYETYLENAAAKARLANLGAHYPALADDSGLEVDALSGRPGIHSHRYAKAPKGGKTQLSPLEQSRANIELLLSELQGKPAGKRTARFVATLVLVMEGILVHASGTLEGTITEAPRGDNGFGYDPIFIPKGYDRTLAELTDDEKNSISHRAVALHELMRQVKSRGMTFAKP